MRAPRWLWVLAPVVLAGAAVAVNELLASWELARAKSRYRSDVGPVESVSWFENGQLDPARNGGALLQRLAAAWPLSEASDALLAELGDQPASAWSDDALRILEGDLDGAADWLQALRRLPETERSSLGIDPRVALSGSLPEEWLALRRVGLMTSLLARDSLLRDDCDEAVFWTVALERVAAYLAAEPLVVLQLLALNQAAQLQRVAREVVEACGPEVAARITEALDHHDGLRQGFARALGAEGAIGHERALDARVPLHSRFGPDHPKRAAAATLDAYRDLVDVARDRRPADALQAAVEEDAPAAEGPADLAELLRRMLTPNLLHGIESERIVEAAEELTLAGIEIIDGGAVEAAISDRVGPVGDGLEARPVAAGLQLAFPRSRSWLESGNRAADATLLEWGVRTVELPD